MRIVSPRPNCGHRGPTFTWIAVAAIWMCALCVASIGQLYQTCAHCGRLPREGEQFVDVFRAGRLCNGCRFNFLRTHRAS